MAICLDDLRYLPNLIIEVDTPPHNLSEEDHPRVKGYVEVNPDGSLFLTHYYVIRDQPYLFPVQEGKCMYCWSDTPKAFWCPLCIPDICDNCDAPLTLSIRSVVLRANLCDDHPYCYISCLNCLHDYHPLLLIKEPNCE